MEPGRLQSWGRKESDTTEVTEHTPIDIDIDIDTDIDIDIEIYRLLPLFSH